MSKQKKYESLICEKPVADFVDSPRNQGKNIPVLFYDSRHNPESPFLIEWNLRYGPGGGAGDGTPEEFLNPSFYPVPDRGWPHKHPYYETFNFMGTDPDHPDELCGTHEFWLGEGEEAEQFLWTKPTTILVPPNTTHLPTIIREARRPYISLTLFNGPLWLPAWVPKVPSGFKSEGGYDYTAKQTKYGKYASVMNVEDLKDPPSHAGKSKTVLHYDYYNNNESPFYIHCRLINGSGIAFGVGDSAQFPKFPHKHPCYEIFSFASTDPEHLYDLGATVEFWLGEGDDAEEYIITKPTTIIVPKHVAHLPIYVRETHHPFMMATVLASPLWGGIWVEKLPPAFKHL